MKSLEKIKFDPGYAPLVLEAMQQLGYTYYTFKAINNMKLKKISFISVSKKIEKYLKTNIAFYLGCLMWAEYISQFEDIEIEGNKLLGENCDESEYLSEADFLIDLIEKQLPRDCKYFLNKNIMFDKSYNVILKTYREFLILNEGFCNCSNTSCIKLPNNLKKLEKTELENLNNIIQNTIEEKNLDRLLDYYDLIF